VNVAVYVPGFAAGDTVPNLPPLSPERANEKSALLRPDMGFPAASFGSMVTVSVSPAVITGSPKVTLVSPGSTLCGTTVKLGCAFSFTPLTMRITLLADPATAPVKSAL
jgi:hypothetical protein